VKVDSEIVTNPYVLLTDQSEIVLFNDINKDGFKQVNEEYLTDYKYSLENIYHTKDYSFSKGWNLVGFPLLIFDDKQTEIKTARELINHLVKQGVEATQIGVYRDGRWLLASKRNDMYFSDDF